jgi:hypothetical protein
MENLMMHWRSPAATVSDSDGRIVARYRGDFCALLIRQWGRRVEGWFSCDGPFALAAWPSTDGMPPVPAVHDGAPPERGPRSATADRSPVGPARRIVLTDDRGDPERVEWELMSPEEFDRTLAARGGDPVPARESPLPRVRVDEYYDADGELSHTIWAPR